MFYAVHHGRKEGIYTSRDECKKQTDNFPKACYKKFYTLDKAKYFREHGTVAPHDATGKNIVYIKTTACTETSGSSSKASHGMVWPNDKNKNSAKRPSGAKETSNRAAVEAIADDIEKDIYGQNVLTIPSCSEYAVKDYNIWYKKWIAQGWKTSDGKPVKNRDAFEKGLALRKKRPGEVDIKWVRKQKTDEYDLAEALAKLALDKDKN